LLTLGSKYNLYIIEEAAFFKAAFFILFHAKAAKIISRNVAALLLSVLCVKQRFLFEKRLKNHIFAALKGYGNLSVQAG